MAELDYMPFFIADWLLDVEDLSPDGYRAYHMLLCKMWLNRSNALPADPKILRNRANVSPQKWPHVWAEIEHYFVVENGEIRSQTLDKVRGKARATHAARAQAGRKGAAAKWLKNNNGHNGRAYGKADGIKTKTLSKDKGLPLFSSNGGSRQPLGAPSIAAIKEGKRWALTHVTAQQAWTAIEAGLVTEEECREVGLI